MGIQSDMKKFIFDVDGTLTPSRQVIDPQFKEFFLEFMRSHKVWLVTGSDYKKTLEQLGSEICNSVATVYNCSGNDVWFKGKRVNAKPFHMPDKLKTFLQGWLQASPFALRTGNHIEERMGTVNYSVVGRNATLGERKLYIKHDLANRERETIAFQINSDFRDITATVGGETGIDIYPKGHDKSQILDDFDAPYENILFFGDKMEIGGNDWPLAKHLPEKNTYHVKDWKDTKKILESIINKE